ncbi:cytochrome b/b6 domain-containing protein [Caldimonas brevitalea]|uniref:Cytochrome B561 n=1 Tax=Caldimonas brevitalea TaxID=413882 RepID=A0A0G3BQJ9_9BURK|nr:cytochrome b/b6 domain-containing protein [Caldimonas brevitalea]AKJ31717.1 cytochrome B561 [Caldimonas brevitalea]
MKIRIWDLPTRLFHWALAASVIGLVVTAKTGGNAMVWHFRLGYLVLALLLFRLAWGLVGGHWSRFATFVYGPRSVLRYLRGGAPAAHTAGHNPLGSFSVFALLLALAAQVTTGLFADDEIAYAGPLAHQVSAELSLSLTWYHKVIGEPLLIALVVLHLLALAFYIGVKRQRLVAPMWHGDKEVDGDLPASRDGAGARWLALAVFAAAGAVAAWVSRIGS